MSEIKIKTLPRSNEKIKQAEPVASSRFVGRIMMVLSLSAFFVGALGLWSSPAVDRGPAKIVRVDDRVNAVINRHMADTHLRETMMRRKSEWENRVTAPGKLATGEAEQLPEDNRTYGVQLDQDDTAERLYQELNGNKDSYGDNMDEKINQRLANRKWLNEQEKAERMVFIKNFIRSAYDRGYEVQLNANLVVTGVKPIRKDKTVNIEQVLERIAKQGQ